MGTNNEPPRTSSMKSAIFFALLAVAACRPQDQDSVEVYLVSEDSDPIEGFNHRHEFELDNGVSVAQIGSSDTNGASVMTGSFTFPLPDGTFATVNWVADALGFRAESPLLPVAPVNPHETPAHVQEQIAFVAAQQAAGLVWDQTLGAWV